MSTQWGFIPGFEGRYKVSDEGEVWSCDRFENGRQYVGKRLSPSTNRQGYKRVILYTPGSRPKTYNVHRAVLEAFDRRRSSGEICRHLDGDPANNRLENLSWGTPSQNMYDKSSHGTDHQRNKTHCPRNHRLVEPNLQGRKLKDGWRTCRACHQASSDRFNGSSLTYEQLADMRYFMISTGRGFSHGRRRAQEVSMYDEAKKWMEEKA